MIHLEAVRESFDSRIFAEVARASRERNIAESLNKWSTCYAMMYIFTQHLLDVKRMDWKIRDSVPGHSERKMGSNNQ